MRACCSIAALSLFVASTASAGTYFVEAESFKSSGGWQVVTGREAREASGLAELSGASGDRAGVAAATVSVKDAGQYRIWVRYASHPKYRGPFRVTALAGERELASGLFDAEFEGRNARDQQTWKSFTAELPEGEVTLRLSKHENQNSSGLARHVDCVLLTMDDDLVPNHLYYGAQTYARVTIGPGYERPMYLHIFADHYHAPWYQHFSIGKQGGALGIAPKKADLLASGDVTPWCNLTPLIYQDSGAMLHVSARHGYTDFASRLRARIEVATAPDEAAIVRTFELDCEPGGFAIYLPPNLLTPENVALCKIDREIAEATGKLADAHPWPTHGKRPERFPFLVSAHIASPLRPSDAEVTAREQKTLDYFGFTHDHHRHVSGLWFMHNDSYCQPDLDKMKSRAATMAADYRKTGADVSQIVFAELMDEPGGQSLEVIAKDQAYLERFRAWLKGLDKTPADLLVADWDAVRLVTQAERDASPGLYYFSQRFRTRALGDFMATQRAILEEAYGRQLPTLVNFSDGAVYTGNFYAQGVDYFELLDAADQNAIWGEDWSNLASTYQCASYNVDLMRAAARERGQTIGHHLIAYAGRKSWDIKLKATSEVARGVKIFNNFCYGPKWATHEGGPYYRSSVWQAKPETWTANAAITREIGAAEDLLIDAMPAPAKVALLYSTSSDAWTLGENLAYGFDRMHTWLALAHEQVPVDVLGERQIAGGSLDGYQVCYLTGPNVSRAAAEKLKAWVRNGGTLWLTAGAAARDEFNRPLNVLDDLLPAKRGECQDMKKHVSSGKYLRLLAAQDEVRWSDKSGDATSEVLSVKQSLKPKAGAEMLARFKDGTAAVVLGPAGTGHVYLLGYLPALGYIKPALVARNALEDRSAKEPGSVSPDEATMLDRSANPWEFPTAIREFILRPVRAANVTPPIRASVPLIDAVYMTHANGIVVPLANYTNRPIPELRLSIAVPDKVARVESAVRGAISFRSAESERVECSLPLESNDFLKLYFK